MNGARIRELAFTTSCAMEGDEGEDAKVIEAAIRQAIKDVLGPASEAMRDAATEMLWTKYQASGNQKQVLDIWTAMAQARSKELEG